MRFRIILVLFLFFAIFISCKEDIKVENPVAKAVLFIDFTGIEVSNISKEISPNLDIILRSGTEIQISNPDSQEVFSLLKINSESEFTEIVKLNSPGRNIFYIENDTDSLDVFTKAVDIFKDEKPVLFYIDVTSLTSRDLTLTKIDSLFGLLLSEINYSIWFDKTIIVLAFSSVNNSIEIPMLIHGPKIRSGVELKEQIKISDLQTSIFNVMEITPPDTWQGSEVENLFSKNFNED